MQRPCVKIIELKFCRSALMPVLNRVQDFVLKLK